MRYRAQYAEPRGVSVEYDATNERLSDAVIAAVADAENTPPTALPPLTDVVDPDALDGLFEAADGSRRGQSKVFFRYAGRHVTVDGGTTVRVSA